MTPAVEEVLVIEPPCSSSVGSAARHTKNVPVRLTPIMRFQSASVVSVAWAKRPTPAMLHTTVTEPSSALTAAMACATWSSSVTSQRKAAACPDPSPRAPLISSTTALRCVSEMSTHATAAPSAARRRVVARPIPLPAPVTNAVRPANRPGVTAIGSVPAIGIGSAERFHGAHAPSSSCRFATMLATAPPSPLGCSEAPATCRAAAARAAAGPSACLSIFIMGVRGRATSTTTASGAL